MSQAFDVIIIGGGIMGCSSAFELAGRGLNVLVLDKKSIGEGPSGRSSAIIRQHYSNELTARMALHSLRVFQNFDELVGGECAFTRCGFAIMVEEKDRAGLAANLALQQRLGIQTAMITPEELLEMAPGLDLRGGLALAYEPDSGYADPYMTVNAYAQAARRRGASVKPNIEVTAVRFRGGRVRGVDTTKGAFDAPMVLNMAGAWGARVARLAEVEAPIDSCRVQVAFFRRPPGHEAAHPVIADFVNATYFRSETGNLTLVGLIDPEEANAVVDPDRFNEGMDSEFVLEAGGRLVERYPAMEASQSTGGYASLYAITPDWHPIIDQVPEGSGFYICSGFSGHGFKLGPAVSVIVADLVTGNSEPAFDASMFRHSRFAEGKPVRGQYEYSIVG